MINWQFILWKAHSKKTSTCKLKQYKTDVTRRERPKSALYLRVKNIQGITIGNIRKKIVFFRMKVFFKKVAQCQKTQKRSFRLNKRFYKPKTSKNARGFSWISFENFRKKSHSAEKKPRRGTLWSRLYLWKH